MTIQFCTQTAQQLPEQILGSALKETTSWFLLEYRQPWAAKALKENTLPENVNSFLGDLQKETPGSRLQFIKQRSESRTQNIGEATDIHFYVALSHEQRAITYRFLLSSYDELLTLDIPAILEHKAEYQANRTDEPLFIVCTNGKRDACCAKWGLPLYQKMAAYGGESVWQTTHTGGHRFAATLICLPHGMTYGWLTEEDAVPLIDAHRRGETYRLDRYRGRSCYQSMTQAADTFLRQKTGLYALSAYQHATTEAVAEREWMVKFIGQEEETTHALHISQTISEQSMLMSCPAQEPEPVRFYELKSYQQL